MRLAMVAAGFTPGEADQLRRAMGAWRRTGAIEKFRAEAARRHDGQRLPGGFAEQICSRRSAASANTAFPNRTPPASPCWPTSSAWLKYHYPAAFAAALLNSQPMGFYAPAQLVATPASTASRSDRSTSTHSDWDCTLEQFDSSEERDSSLALRLGFRMLSGLSQTHSDAIMARVRRGRLSRSPILPAARA